MQQKRKLSGKSRDNRGPSSLYQKNRIKDFVNFRAKVEEANMQKLVKDAFLSSAIRENIKVLISVADDLRQLTVHRYFITYAHKYNHERDTSHARRRHTNHKDDTEKRNGALK
jgi:hypothetical protein